MTTIILVVQNVINNKQMQLYRHGEFRLKEVSKVPENAKLVESGKSLTVAHSETGHNHIMTLENTKEAEIKIFEFEGKTYIDIPIETKLTHQKTYEAHRTITVKPGIYEKYVQDRFSYAEKAMKKVID